MTIHERIAETLGWSEQGVRSFSFHSLRELVRHKNPELADEITEYIRTGLYLIDNQREKVTLPCNP